MPPKSSKKYQLTINHPKEKGLGHEEIQKILLDLKSVEYFCLADEVGEQGTYHTHIFLYARSPIRFETIKKHIPEAHIEAARGSCQENRNYICKEGKWEKSSKAETRIPDSFFEYGELPEEVGQGFRSDIAELYSMIVDGMNNAEIMAANPELAVHISRMDKIRQDVLEARYKDSWRDLDVTYIFGPTATGKTRGVMEKHEYSNVFHVTDYGHPFDRYASQPVLLFDEFRSSLHLGDMLDYLDGYPLNLPARYAQRVACFTTVYIISNIDLCEQFPNMQKSEPRSWEAFLRRIHKVIEYKADGSTIDHGNALNYIFPPEPVPDWVQQAMEAEDYGELPY